MFGVWRVDARGVGRGLWLPTIPSFSSVDGWERVESCASGVDDQAGRAGAAPPFLMLSFALFASTKKVAGTGWLVASSAFEYEKGGMDVCARCSGLHPSWLQLLNYIPFLVTSGRVYRKQVRCAIADKATAIQTQQTRRSTV